MRENNEYAVDVAYEKKSYYINQYRSHYMMLGKLYSPFEFEQDMREFNNRMILLTQPVQPVEETIQPVQPVEETIQPVQSIEETNQSLFRPLNKLFNLFNYLMRNN